MSKRTLTFKITTMISLIVLATTIAVGIFAFIAYRNDSQEMHKNRAVAIAQSLAVLIDPDEFLLAFETNEKNEYYLWLQAQFDRAKADLEALFLFAGKVDEDVGFIAFMEALLPTDIRTVDLNTILPLEIFPPAIFYAQSGLASAAAIMPSGVDDSYVLPAYAPIFDRQGIPIGIVGINVDVTDVFVKSNNFAWTIGTIVAGIIILIIWIPIFWVRHYISKPLTALCQASDSIAGGNMNTNIPLTSNDEMGILERSFRNMQTEVSVMIDEVRKKSNELVRGNLKTDKFEYTAKGDFQKILNSMDSVADSVFQYINNLPCSITIFDGEYRFSFLNNYTVNHQGYKPDVFLNKTIFETMPPNESEALGKAFDMVKSSGETLRHQVEMVSPKGEPFNIDQAVIPIKNSLNEITSFLVFGYEITDLVRSQERSNKISEYQKAETNRIVDAMNAGYAQGIMRFDFEPAPYDGDTAAFAEVFKKISWELGDTALHLREYMDEIKRVLSAIEKGDLSARIETNFIGDFTIIQNSINNISETFSKTMREIAMASEQVLLGAQQISHSTATLAGGATEQASSVEELNASIEMINLRSKENARNAKEAGDMSDKSTESAQEGNNAMRKMLEAMAGIKESGGNISKIIKTIQDIAFQTNLLALNAAVEAARAGEHGRGFSVVAEEVRNLASRSQTAASETTELIEDSVRRVDTGSHIAESTAAALDIIVKNAEEVVHIIQGISDSSQEQSVAVGQISEGLGQISSVIQSNSAISEETAAAAQELNSQAETLKQLVGYFKF